VVLAIGRRMRRGIGVSHADKEHIHHRLMDIGHSHRQAVLLMYLWSALVSGCALAVAFIDGRVLVSVILVAAVLLATVLPRLVRDRAPRGSDRELAPANGSGPRHRRRRGRAPVATSVPAPVAPTGESPPADHVEEAPAPTARDAS
jgi:UDP-GlcNAc:undecaprenyl-phosphate GlcNAc-1-phosphate transferase